MYLMKARRIPDSKEWDTTTVTEVLRQIAP